MKTYIPKLSEIEEKWWLVDAEGQIVGRLAARIAKILQGKNRPTYTPHMKNGDYVVVVNAEKVRFTGKKLTNKTYYRYSMWPGGVKATTPRELLAKKPEEILRHAVWGMMPKTRLGHALMKRLRIYSGPNHGHAAQNPQPVNPTARATRSEVK